jgi:hypothetical protein
MAVLDGGAATVVLAGCGTSVGWKSLIGHLMPRHDGGPGTRDVPSPLPRSGARQWQSPPGAHGVHLA